MGCIPHSAQVDYRGTFLLRITKGRFRPNHNQPENKDSIYENYR